MTARSVTQRRRALLISTTVWLVAVLLTAGSCEQAGGVGQVITDMARMAPPAQAPELVKVDPSVVQPQEDALYYPGDSFTVTIKHGIYNAIEFTEDGVALAEPTGNDPAGAVTTVVFLEDSRVTDAEAKTMTETIRIVPKQAALHGASHAYTVRERSVNPDYIGTPQEFSHSTTWTMVTVVTDPAVFVDPMPTQIVIGAANAFDVSWSSVGTKRVVVKRDDEVLFDRAAPGASFDFTGKVLINPTRSGTITVTVEGWDALGNAVTASSGSVASQPKTYRGSYLTHGTCVDAGSGYAAKKNLSYGCVLESSNPGLPWNLYTWPRG